MRLPVRALVPVLALAVAIPAAAQELGERTRAPESMVPALAPGQDDLAAAIAAAANHPLGSLENPVRVGGPDGERNYVARLRCADGSTPRIAQQTAGGVGAFGTVVDALTLDCAAAAPGRTTLMMDMYHEEHVEDRAPPGFSIQPR